MLEIRWGKADMRLADYVLVRPIAVGGFGEVWLAKSALRVGGADTAPGSDSLELTVAIKLVMDDVGQEAEKIHSINHQNVVRVRRFGREGPLYWLAMEHVDGWTFAQLMDHLPAGLKLPASAALDLTIELCNGLKAVHDARHNTTRKPLGIIHRDIKPSNLMVSFQGEVKILDFGIAKVRSAGGVTAAPQRLYTPRYAAPEQHMGGPVSPATDIFSTALVFAELLSGEQVFAEPTGNLDADVDRQRLKELKLGGHAARWVESRRKVLGPYADLLARCLATHPEERLQSVNDVLVRLVQLREAYPAGLSIELLVELLRTRTLPPDMSTPLPADWQVLVRVLQTVPFPRLIPDELLKGVPMDLQKPPREPAARLTAQGVAWPEDQRPSVHSSAVYQAPQPHTAPAPIGGSPVSDQQREASSFRAPPEPMPTRAAGLTLSPRAQLIATTSLYVVLVLALLFTLGGLIAKVPWTRLVASLPSTADVGAPTQEGEGITPVEAGPNPPEPPPAACPDADSDNHHRCEPPGAADDCDDANPNTFPGAPEACDGRDNDCDGQLGEGEDTTTASGALTCARPAEVAPEARPSDVGRTTSSGGRGQGGEAPPPPQQHPCYVDRDRDGFGTLELKMSSRADCKVDGLSRNSGDCDDTPGSGYAVNPHADENCSNGVDNDCSGPSNDSCQEYVETVEFNAESGTLKATMTLTRGACQGVTISYTIPGEAKKTMELQGNGNTWTGSTGLSRRERSATGSLSYSFTCGTGSGARVLYRSDGKTTRSKQIP